MQLGGEAKNPGRDLPRAVILSILIGGSGLHPHPGRVHRRAGAQACSTSPARLDEPGHHRAPTPRRQGAQRRRRSSRWPASPASRWLATVLRIDAVISPGGTGLMYLTSASRISFGLARTATSRRRSSASDARQVPVFGVIIATAHRRAVPAAVPELVKARRDGDQRLGADVRRRAAGPRGVAPAEARPAAALPAAGGARSWRRWPSSAPAGSSVLGLADLHDADGGDADRLRADRHLLPVQAQPERPDDRLAARRRGSSRG